MFRIHLFTLIDLTCMVIYTDSILIVYNIIMKFGSSQSAVFTINLHVIDSITIGQSAVYVMMACS